MSLSDLRKLDLLRPETEWSGDLPRSTVHATLAMASALLGAGGCVGMMMGDGGVVTWFGLAAFGVALAVFTAVNVLAIGGRRTEDNPSSQDD